jgi:glucoamylase
MGWVDFAGDTHGSISFDIVLAFGGSEAEAMNVANATLGSDLGAVQRSYISGWVTYTNGLDNQGGSADDQYYLAAMTLKSCQDKSNGAIIAGPGTPWGEDQHDDNPGGYHLIWARDLFKFASALLTAGDTASVRKAVDFFFDVQIQTVERGVPGSADFSRPGRFPQNTFVDGRPFWNGTQMDEVAMPVILAWKLH